MRTATPFLATVISALALTMMAPAEAQQGGPKIAFVNTQVILKETPGFALAESTFTKEVEGYRAEAARLQQPAPLPAAELEAARDPAFAGVAPADAPGLVVEAASIAVDQAARGIGDQLAERRDPVLERHPPQTYPP